jgi:hypothetical protein
LIRKSVIVFSSFHGFSIVSAIVSKKSGSKRLGQNVFFEVFNQERDSVGVGLGFAAVVA